MTFVYDVAVTKKLIGFIRVEVEGDFTTNEQSLVEQAKQLAQKTMDIGWPIDYIDTDDFEPEIIGARCVNT